MNVKNDSLLRIRLFEAYYRARQGKRNTRNQLKFEIDFEHNLLQLAKEIEQRRYEPKPCIAFIVNKPVKREIFAADFRDRVVHHLLHGCINHIVEGKLIHDTYSCRKGKGTLYGIKRIDRFIRSCSRNYQRDAHILKLDVSGYFRNMNHEMLWHKVQRILSGRSTCYGGLPREVVDYLLHQVIFTRVTENCRIKCSRAQWHGLPKSKSQFYADVACGLPIGNLTSQLFGNIFLNDFDQFVKHKLGMKYYGRYVDDMVFVHHSREYLRTVIANVRKELASIGLEVHPGKIYLQHYTKGVLFLGHFIKPYRKYISRRTKNNFFQAIAEINTLLDTEKRIEGQVISQIRTKMNSYLGILGQANSYKLIVKSRKRLCPQFFFFFSFNATHTKVIPNIRNLLWHYTQPCLSIKSLMTC
ncbi:MAG TPA: hypothetical protein EYH36_07580 [Desulfocapsa sulfexigens]|nr:hypothetical protein [Desulfocapsa sulfexigens]